jgi:alpha-ketoglutarate-dependent taurine dioxygenase
MSEKLKVIPVAGRIGAIIEGVKLSKDLKPEVFNFIRDAIIEHKVVFFRNQHHLDNQGQEEFAKLFGELVPHPTVSPLENSNYILELNSADGGRANAWHTDVTFVDAYPKFAILRSVEVPQAGGDTVWANTAAAYEDLPQELRDLVDKLWAVHTNEYDYAAKYRSIKNNGDEDVAKRHEEEFTSVVYETEHPVVHVHPETGERHLLLGAFAKNIIGFSQADSQHLISLLQGHITKLENSVRWHWEVGDVAIWDNRATQHYAINDYGEQQRIVRRVTIDGDAPISVDGRHSVTRLKKEKIAAN